MTLIASIPVLTGAPSLLLCLTTEDIVSIMWERAANNTPIRTYGEHCITLDLGFGKTFSWVFLIADARQRIIGADFLQHFDLIADVRGQRVK